jgi:hypothetical protein
MTTIVVDSPKIEKKYSNYEIKMKFIEFLEQDMAKDKFDLYEITEQNLSQESQEKLAKIDTLNFVDY